MQPIQNTDNTKGTWKGLAVGIAMAIWWVLTTVAGGALWLLNKVTSALDSHNTMGSLVDAAGEVIKHLPDSNIHEDDDFRLLAREGEPGICTDHDGYEVVKYHGPGRLKIY